MHILLESMQILLNIKLLFGFAKIAKKYCRDDNPGSF